jgi:hypothetical protein
VADYRTGAEKSTNVSDASCGFRKQGSANTHMCTLMGYVKGINISQMIKLPMAKIGTI